MSDYRTRGLGKVGIYQPQPNFGSNRTAQDVYGRQVAGLQKKALLDAQRASGLNLPFPRINGQYVTPSTPTANQGDWKADLTPDERFIIEHESGYRTDAYNPINTSSGHAFGIGQLTTANRQHYAAIFGFSPDTQDPWQQKQMFRQYVIDRYGNTATAVAHWRVHRSY